MIDIFSISFLKILGAKNNPVRSSISDQYYYFLRKSIFFKHNFPLKDYTKTHKIAQCVMFLHRENVLKRPSTYIILFYTNSSLYKKKINTTSVKNIHQDTPNCTFFPQFSRVVACPLACVHLISLFLYENSDIFIHNAIKIYTKTHQL